MITQIKVHSAIKVQMSTFNMCRYKLEFFKDYNKLFIHIYYFSKLL